MLVVAPRFENTPTGRSPLIRNALLAGVFQNGFPDTDAMMAYTSLETARSLFLLPDDYIDGLHLVVNDPHRVNEVRDALSEAMGPDFMVTTWPERNPILFDALRLEKWAMFIILLLIVLVAAFNIIGTLIMVVIEKTREIGILKSMGARESAIERIFLAQGFIIGGVGTALGTIGGLFVCYLLKYHIKLDIVSEAYLSDSIPILINPWTTVLVVVSSMVICVGAAVYPARQAARLDPVEALRHE
jgi:lipoprotein-releasing system permease protein